MCCRVGLFPFAADARYWAKHTGFALTTGHWAKQLAVHLHGDGNILSFRRRHGRRAEVAAS